MSKNQKVPLKLVILIFLQYQYAESISQNQNYYPSNSQNGRAGRNIDNNSNSPTIGNNGFQTLGPTSSPNVNVGTGRQYGKDTITFNSPWTWICINDTYCQRELSNTTAANHHVSLNVCWLTCGTAGPLWPVPTIKHLLAKSTTSFYPQNVEVINIFAPNTGVKAMLGFAGNLFIDTLLRMHPKSKSEGSSSFPSSSGGRGIEHNIVTISLTSQGGDQKITLDTDESYSLTIVPYYEGQGRRLHIDITGGTYFGVRHGLETLSQLIAFNEIHECLQIVSQAIIQDRPAFKYRGLMIDTARNFIPMRHLRRMVEAMSQNKLNVLHWHITDTNSFPFHSKSVPQMTKFGAYSESQIYSPKEIRELIMYAKLRGVKILPELDAPAHAGNGWQWGSIEGLGELALCINAEPWRQYCGQPPCGQLNPLNQFTYIVLGEIYKDMLEVFDNDIFHMGGDEIFFQCWQTHPEIQGWQRNRSSYDLMELWGLFQDKAFRKLKEANGGRYITTIVWTSDMTTRGRIHLSPADYVIQIWTSSSSHEVKDLLNEKYRVIFSNVDSTYLDHGFGTWLGHDHMWQIKTWQDLYDNDLKRIVEYHLGANASVEALKSGQILGGEATLWSEKVDEHNMEMKLWPRSAALAERLWSDPINRTEVVYARLLHHRERMVRRGIHADRIQPESCHQISGYCKDPYSII